MSAGGNLQASLAGALTALEITGVFDGPPARASFPYVVIDAGMESDWSHKSGEGREVLVAVTVWDDQPSRLHGQRLQLGRAAVHDRGAGRAAPAQGAGDLGRDPLAGQVAVHAVPA